MRHVTNIGWTFAMPTDDERRDQGLTADLYTANGNTENILDRV